MKTSLAVLYGQAPELSTSFQTRQLARHLASYFEVRPLGLPRWGRWGRLPARLIGTYARPWLAPAPAEYLLYGNDGFADLRRFSCKTALYWYDAPWDWTQAPPRRRQWQHWLRYRNVLVADCVFAVSQTQVAMARALRPQRGDSVHYLPVGVDCSVFDPGAASADFVRERYRLPAGHAIIGYLGYIGLVKGRFAGEVLVEAAARLRRRDVHYLVVGFGPGLERFKSAVARAGLRADFTFTGFVAEDQIPDYLAAMDVAVAVLEPGFHSLARSETKLKQYMAMERAIVATAIGENRIDLDDGRCGVLAPPGDEALADAISAVLANPERGAMLGKNARAQALAVYDWRVLAARMAKVLGESTRPGNTSAESHS
jgi:glycosyltransferase involved in cell wall biosynthesis